MSECEECGIPIAREGVCEECWKTLQLVQPCCGCARNARRCDLVWLTMPAFDINGSLRAKRSGLYCEKCAKGVCRYLNGIELTFEQREAFAGAIIDQRWDGRWSSFAAWQRLLETNRKERKRIMELTNETLSRGPDGERAWRPGRGAEFIGSCLIMSATTIRRYTPFGATRPIAETSGMCRMLEGDTVVMKPVYISDWLVPKGLWSLGRVNKEPISKAGVDTFTVSMETWIYLEAVELNEKGYPTFLRLVADSEQDLYREIMERKGISDPTSIRTFYLPETTSHEASPFG